MELYSPDPLKPLPTGWENTERIASLNSYCQVLTEPVSLPPWAPLSLRPDCGLLPSILQRDRKDRGQEADGKKGSPPPPKKKKKTHLRNKNKAYRGTAKVNKPGGWTLKISPSHRMWPPAPFSPQSHYSCLEGHTHRYATTMSHFNKLYQSLAQWIISKKCWCDTKSNAIRNIRSGRLSDRSELKVKTGKLS